MSASNSCCIQSFTKSAAPVARTTGRPSSSSWRCKSRNRSSARKSYQWCFSLLGWLCSLIVPRTLNKTHAWSTTRFGRPSGSRQAKAGNFATTKAQQRLRHGERTATRCARRSTHGLPRSGGVPPLLSPQPRRASKVAHARGTHPAARCARCGLTPRSAPDPLRQAVPAAKRACLCFTSRRAHPASAVGVSSNVRRQIQAVCSRCKASAFGVN